MNPENPEQKLESMESVPPPEERGEEETPFPEHLTEEAIKRSIGPLAQALEQESMNWLVKNDVVDAFERRHRPMAGRFKQAPRRNAMIAGVVVLLIVSFLLPVDPPHVSIGAEPLLAGGPSWLTNSVIHTIIVDLILVVLAFAVTRSLSLIPGRLQNFTEMVFEYLYQFCEDIAGHNARRFSHWALTLFLFIIVSNWTGLIPGVGSIGFYHIGEEHAAEEHVDEEHVDEEHSEEGEEHSEEEPAETEEGAALPSGLAMADNAALLSSQVAMADGKAMIVAPAEASVNAEVAAAEEEGHHTFVPLLRPPSADLNFTFAIAIVTMVMVQVFGVQALGGSYFTKFFNTSGDGFMKGVNIFVSILEIISEISRILSFAFRLFGNIFAGEVVLATMAFLVAFLVPVPFYFLEIFVGFVQALVFMSLALIFFSVATISHHADDHH